MVKPSGVCGSTFFHFGLAGAVAVGDGEAGVCASAKATGSTRVVRREQKNEDLGERQAEESITIVCSYFLPGEVFRKQLKRAIGRGVEIKVVLTGLSDVRIAKYGERFLYRWMLRNGISLYEYNPTVLHAKMAH